MERQQVQQLVQGLAQSTAAGVVAGPPAVLGGQVDAVNRAIAEAVTRRGIGGHSGPRRRLEDKGVALPRFEPKTPFEEWGDSFRHYLGMASKEAIELSKAGALTVLGSLASLAEKEVNARPASS